jgi:CheY-like chemotaxis protein
LATILIAEAEGDILGILRTRLENHGYTVLGASDGAQALQALRNEQDGVDLVITGIQMPRMNGFELGEQLRTEYPRLPVIYMSAYVTDNVVKRARELQKAGLPEDCAFLTMPFSEEEMLRVVRSVLVSE